MVEEIVLMGSFGENLRREREMRGVTLQEISAATKISVRFLKSIENEEFSRLPGGIFNRSFVRAYARYLGLDEDPLMEEYRLAAKAKGETDLTPIPTPKVYSRRQKRFPHALWGVVIAVVLLAFGFTLWRYTRRPSQNPPAMVEQVPDSSTLSVHPSAAKASPSAGGSAAMPAAAGKSSGGSGGSNAQPAKSKPAVPGVLAATSAVVPSAPKVPAITDYDGKLILQIATTERSWVAIDADGKTVMQGIMNPNEVKTFKASNSYDVLTGNAQGVILTLNGQRLKPLGREGEVKQIHLTWDSLKKPSSK